MDTTDQFLVEEDDYVLVERAGTVPGPQEAGGSDSDGGGEEGGEETDPVRLAQREKQVMYGKNTQAYQNYVRMVPRWGAALRVACSSEAVALRVACSRPAPDTIPAFVSGVA